MDVLGQALLDYQNGIYNGDIITHSSLDEEDTLPLPYLFRSFEEMPLLEQKALELVNGSVLDIGCGAGSHALYVKEKGYKVTAIDKSKGAIEVCKQRGIQHSFHADVLDFSLEKYDTLLLLMNGIGIAGKLNRLPLFLQHFKTLLKPNGQILLDSSDIIYMFDEDTDGGHWVPGDVDYYGEVQFQMGYDQKKGPIFDWLYLDFNTLREYAEQEKLQCDLICNGNHYDYLARLILK